ncbi:MAG: hypothetical protein CM15mP71_6900 [Candidatus Poseidoniales archaeon]|nr:MAG: hypothetical protein CM15mP71_6900 [Candidatus Poseidoniales archaeon]
MEHRIPWLGPGDEGVWMDTLSDVMRAWGQLALLPGIDIVRSMILGHSAGGHMALMMAAVAKKTLAFYRSITNADIVQRTTPSYPMEDAVRRWMGCHQKKRGYLAQG